MRELFTPRRIKAFTSKILGTDLDSCWLWIGYMNKQGYGSMCVNQKGKVTSLTVQRVSYTLFWGEIPRGLTVDHMCRNRGCANPYHLRAITNRQNVLAGMCQAAQNARKTHCKRGHALSGANVLLIKNGEGGRACRTCAKIHKDAWDLRNR